jgi:hypothetical protein
MRKLILLALCLLPAFVNAQIKAVTEKGDEVWLKDDGTWAYVNDTEEKSIEIPFNKKEFKKEQGSTFLLKSSKANLGFWLDSKKWSFTKETSNPSSEYELQCKDKDLYGMILIEKIEIPLETLKGIAFKNAQEAAPDMKIIKEEYRTVNGLKVLLMQMNGSMQGIKFSYYGYYFSNKNGSVQYVTYTAQNLMSEYENECDILLNGLVELN